MFETKKKIYEELVTLFPMKEIEIEKFISVAMRPEGPKMGFVHSMGMHEIFGLPDLEITNVHPRMLMPAAGHIINQICQYMLNAKQGLPNHKELKLGESIGLSAFEKFRVVESKSNYHKTPTWEVIEAEPHKCDACGKVHDEQEFH